MTIHYRKLPERTRAMFENKLAELHLNVRDFTPLAVDEAVQRAASSSGSDDKLSPREAATAAADLRARFDRAWQSYANAA